MLVLRRDTQAEKGHMSVLSLEILTHRAQGGRTKVETNTIMTGNEEQHHTTNIMNETMGKELRSGSGERKEQLRTKPLTNTVMRQKDGA